MRTSTDKRAEAIEKRLLPLIDVLADQLVREYLAETVPGQLTVSPPFGDRSDRDSRQPGQVEPGELRR